MQLREEQQSSRRHHEWRRPHAFAPRQPSPRHKETHWSNNGFICKTAQVGTDPSVGHDADIFVAHTSPLRPRGRSGLHDGPTEAKKNCPTA